MSVALALLLMTAGCGDDSTETVSSEAISASVEKMESGEVRYSLELDGGTIRPFMDGKFEGVIDASNDAFSISLDVGASLSTLVRDEEKRQELLGKDEKRIEARFLGKKAYVFVPEGEKSWVLFDLEKEEIDAATFLRRQLGTQVDPLGLLENLRGISGEFEQVGEENLHGVSTTKYQTRILAAEAVRQFPTATEFLTEEDLLRLTDFEVPVFVWLDESERLHKYQVAVDMDVIMEAAGEKVEGQSLGKIQLDLEIFDYDKDIKFEAPPEEDVMDFRSFLKSFSQENQSRVGNVAGDGDR